MKTQNILSPHGFLRDTVLPFLGMTLLCLFAIIALDQGVMKLMGIGLAPVPLSYYLQHSLYHYCRVWAAPGKYLFSIGSLLCLFVFAVLWFRGDGERRRFYGVWFVFATLMSSGEVANHIAFLLRRGTTFSFLLNFVCFLILLWGVYCFADWYSKRGSDEDLEEGALESHQ